MINNRFSIAIIYILAASIGMVSAYADHEPNTPTVTAVTPDMTGRIIEGTTVSFNIALSDPNSAADLVDVYIDGSHEGHTTGTSYSHVFYEAGTFALEFMPGNLTNNLHAVGYTTQITIVQAEPPTIRGITHTVGITEYQPASFSITLNDPDDLAHGIDVFDENGDSIDYIYAPSTTYTTTFEDAGARTLTFKVWAHGYNYTDSHDVSFTVQGREMPSITSVTQETTGRIIPGSTVSFSVTLSDPNDEVDVVEVFVDGEYADYTTGTTYEHTFDTAGTYNLDFKPLSNILFGQTGSYEDSYTDSHIIQITVSGNTVPTISNIAYGEPIIIHQSAFFTVELNDPDDLAYAVDVFDDAGNNVGLIDLTDGSYSPLYTKAGEYTLTFKLEVLDSGYVDSQEVTFIVQEDANAETPADIERRNQEIDRKQTEDAEKVRQEAEDQLAEEDAEKVRQEEAAQEAEELQRQQLLKQLQDYQIEQFQLQQQQEQQQQEQQEHIQLSSNIPSINATNFVFEVRQTFMVSLLNNNATQTYMCVNVS